jgi:MscS family membrane protein
VTDWAARALRASLIVCVLASAVASAQPIPTPGAPAAPPAAEAPKDPLGRSTPRGTLLGFLAAARGGDEDLASHYLDAPSGSAAQALARQLFVVLDVRLPARITLVSDAPEGSRTNPLAPDEERIGSIEGPEGRFDIVVERVRRAKADPIWLFSSETLQQIPAVYEQIQASRAARWLPRFLTERRASGVRLYEWLAVLIGLPLFYIVTALLNRALMPLIRLLGRRLFPNRDGPVRSALPAPVRLVLIVVAARWLVATLPLSLLVRQHITNATAILAVIAIAWLLILLNGEVERHLVRRIPAANYSAAVSLLRVGRRLVDVLIVMAGVFAMLRRLGVDATPLLAGLGVGGIAVALAAQKTLENLIAGASLIFDQAVRVGDFLRVGTIEGVVEHIGLRSTRIRTLDRSVVSVPNSQIANMSLETLSARDKFWFHPVVGLRYETTNDQMHLVLDGVRKLLARHATIEANSIRVRFLRLGAYSLDVDVFAYILARDWAHFLEIQEELLLRIAEIVNAAGTSMAFPSQTMYVENQASIAAASEEPHRSSGEQEIRR